LYPLVDEDEPNFEERNAFRYYAAATMELDDAIGMIMDELKNRGLEDKTLIVIFGDHNAYYQSLTNYVKNIYPIEQKYENVTELYRVPLMVRVGNGLDAPQVISKFTCTADIPPTIMSLLGIKYYSNLFYGHSVFSSEESILYSRAYDVFLTDKMYFTTLHNVLWQAEDADSAYLTLAQRL
jgi:phosphoglycerol transferase MdoB-like AlkP superfamily enzyme